MGTLLQAATYGATIPVIIGMTRSAPLLIWAAALRAGTCRGKKTKSGKKGGTQYIENVDFLVGHNPIFGVNQFWLNGTNINLQAKKFSQFPSPNITIPDARFYSVIGVTATVQMGPFTFDDYGSTGPVTLPLGPTGGSGFIEVPLWNACQNGPDQIDSSQSRWWPYYYRWRPDFGPTVYIEGSPNYNSSNFTVYYYALVPKAEATPAEYVCLVFEPQLGDDPIAYGALQSQRILYPEYAGLGSKDFDLGQSGQLPDISAEVAGSFMIYPTGDADFADMIEYACKSGQVQAGLALTINDAIQGIGPVQATGLNALDHPNIVQKKYMRQPIGSASSPFTFPLDMQITVGNWLLVLFACAEGVGPFSISDTFANVWTTITNQHIVFGGWNGTWLAAFYTKITSAGTAAALDQISIAWASSFLDHVRVLVIEVQGYDTIDFTNVNTGTSAQGNVSMTTGNQPRQPELIFTWGAFSEGIVDTQPLDETNWTDLIGQTPLTVTGSVGGGTFQQKLLDFVSAQYRIVRWPTSLTWKFSYALTNAWAALAIGFYNSAPSPLPITLENIIDNPTMIWARQAARVGGLNGSITMNSQRKCSDYLKDFYYSMNAWPVWSGFRLKSIPRNEVSGLANGAAYQSPTSPGPIFNLTDANGDFLGDANTAPLVVKRRAQSDAFNILQLQTMDRSNNYNPTITSQPEPGAIAFYAPRKAAPEQHPEVQTTLVARMLLGIAVRREIYLRNTYEFTLQPKYAMLEPGDLVTLTDSQAGLFNVPVRILSIEEDNQAKALKCSAEPFIYGLHNPTPISATAPTGGNPPAVTGGVLPVNTPIFLEPVPPLSGNPSQRQLWIGVSDADPEYGGCAVYISTDGGNTYNQIGSITGSAITGLTVGDWPAETSPDTFNDLVVNLSESLGVLKSYSVQDEDEFTFPCYVQGGAGNIPYEIMTYALAVMISTGSVYALKATGTGNHLDRAVFGAPNAGGVGVDHPNGSRFMFIGAVGALGGGNPVSSPLTSPAAFNGIMALPLNPQWIGVTLHFKFPAFNAFGGAAQALADAMDYTYTPTGLVGNVNPNGLPPQIFLVDGA